MRFCLILAALSAAPAGLVQAQTSALPAWIHADSSARTVMLDLTVTHPAGAPSAQISRGMMGIS